MEECPLCKFSSDIKANLESHLQKAHNKFRCDHCQALLSPLNTLIKHKYFAHGHITEGFKLLEKVF